MDYMNTYKKRFLCKIGIHDWVTWTTDRRYGWCQDFGCDKNTIPEFHPLADWGRGQGKGKP